MMEIIPARMVNEVAYCPRLFSLEHVFGDFEDNEHTVEGRTVHRRVDRPTTATLPSPGEDGEVDDPDRPRAVRRVHLSDFDVGAVAIIDLVEVRDGHVVPVDYKKGVAPDIPEGAWEPERVQIGVQALLLRAHGYRVDHGVLYFAGSKRRVEVPVDDALEATTRAYIAQARDLLERRVLPPPLVDSPKCHGCSLVGICLPDETNALRNAGGVELRGLVPARDDALPLHITLNGGRAGLSGGEIVVTDRKGEKVARARVQDTSQVVIHGNVTLTTPLIHALAERDVPIAMHSSGGWYYGTFHPATGRNVLVRHAQHRAAADAERALAVARWMITAKIHNQRVMLRRNARGVEPTVLAALRDAVEQARQAQDPDTLRGIEGMAARRYFESLPLMLKGDLAEQFAFDGRNRRPPRDPINALLSFAYAVLAREAAHVLHRVGLDPHVGFLHTMRHGRPALALDLMEEFRPILADSAVLSAVNNGVLTTSDFIIHPVGCNLKPEGRKRFIQVLERRLDELVTHPTLQTRWSYRRVLEVQSRMLSRHLLGELDTYPGFQVR